MYKKFLVITFFFVIGNSSISHAQIMDAIKAVTTKVIRALDLQIQRLQNNTIDLQNAQKQIENTLSKLKLNEIADWTSKQKGLYQEYFDELWKAKVVLSSYKQFTDIVTKQKELLTEYKQAYSLVSQDSHFSQSELDYVYGIYNNILNASIQNVNNILTMMQSYSVQMSDAGRLKMINNTSNEIDGHLTALRQFNQHNQLLSLQRAQSESDLEDIKKLYGLQ